MWIAPSRFTFTARSGFSSLAMLSSEARCTTRCGPACCIARSSWGMSVTSPRTTVDVARRAAEDVLQELELWRDVVDRDVVPVAQQVANDVGADEAGAAVTKYCIEPPPAHSWRLGAARALSPLPVLMSAMRSRCGVAAGRPASGARSAVRAHRAGPSSALTVAHGRARGPRCGGRGAAASRPVGGSYTAHARSSRGLEDGALRGVAGRADRDRRGRRDRGALGVSAYNGLVRRRLRVDEAWAQIDVQLKRRHGPDPEPRERRPGRHELRGGRADDRHRGARRRRRGRRRGAGPRPGAPRGS